MGQFLTGQSQLNCPMAQRTRPNFWEDQFPTNSFWLIFVIKSMAERLPEKILHI